MQYLLLLLVFFLTIPSDTSDFEIAKDFELLLVAKEPLLEDPVDLEFDEHGDAYVLEMPGYPFGDAQSRIRLMKDSNGDGVFEESTVFADNLGLADSFLPYEKGFLVASPPYLLHLQDVNQDKQVDKIDTLMGGFAKQNLQHNYNGLTYGLDQWIYAANGGNDGKPYWWGKPETAITLRGQDLRFNLETRQMELLGESSGGFGLALDPYGRVFETHNLEHVSHLVFPSRYLRNNVILPGHTLENISSYSENGLARIYPIGEQEDRMNHPEQSGYFSGACGITFYGGGSFGETFENTLWVADVVLNLVHVMKMEANGSSFSAHRLLENKEFLASKNRSFRPVNMSVGPDGSLYVVDMHRKVIEHPEWIPDEIEKNLDLDAGKKQGRLYKISPKDKKLLSPKFRFDTIEDKLAMLSHPNQWVRNTAQRLLMEERVKPQDVEPLLSSQNDMARLHAMWLLANQNLLSIENIEELLKDKNPGIRENALLIAEKLVSNNHSLITSIAERLKDSSPRVVMQAALSLSTIEIPPSYQEKVLKELILTSSNLKDTWQEAALALAAKQFAGSTFEQVIQQKEPNINLLATLALNAESQFPDFLNSIQKAKITANNKAYLIESLAKSRHLSSSYALEKSIQEIEENAELEILIALATMRSQLHLEPSKNLIEKSQKALKAVTNRKLSLEERLTQLKLLAFIPYLVKKEQLYASLENSQPIELQKAALRQLGSIREPEIGREIVARWDVLSPSLRREASDVLLYVETNNAALLDGLENGSINIGEMNFDLERRRTLLWWTEDKDIRERAQKLFSDSGLKSRQEVITQMKPALELTGNPKNGYTIFTNTCSMCHTYQTIGTEVGPNLTEINRKSKATILHEILNPNASVDPKYINHSLETKSGQVHLGIVAAENDQAITLQKIGGEKVTVQKKDIKRFRSLGSSLMMEGFENALSHQEMADLIAFLQKGSS